MGQVVTSSVNLAILWTIAKVRPQIEPRVREAGLKWAYVKDLLKKVDTVEEIQRAVELADEELQKWLLERDGARSKQSVDPAEAINKQERQKMVWPCILQLSAS